MSFKAVVTDFTYPNLSIEEEILRPHARLEAAQCKTDADIAALAADADVVITQLAPVRAPAIAQFRKVRAIVRYGVGFDNVDIAAAAQQGIPVCNVPDYCVDEVADHALALLLTLTRQVVPNTLQVRSGAWKMAGSVDSLRTLSALTVGVLGFGRIGRAVVKRLVAFGAHVLVFDPAVTAEIIAPSGARGVGLDELLASSDAITLHCPSMPATRGIIRQESLAKMKPGSLLVNTSRGDLVVLADLTAALARGHLGGAALDVTDPEPLPVDSPLRAMPQVILNPHIAWASGDSSQRLRRTVAEIARLALLGQPLPNIVNGVKSPRS